MSLEFIGLRFLVFPDFLKLPSSHSILYLLILSISEVEMNCNMIENTWVTEDENTTQISYPPSVSDSGLPLSRLRASDGFLSLPTVELLLL